jgi:4-amino-4-deoxy-L-arabinose transferase-like glycosyltransferase
MFPSNDANRYGNPSRRTKLLALLCLFALTVILYFDRLDLPLLEPEEARYAEIPRQMLVEGRFLTPVLHGEDYWQKPPLLYWLVMLSYRLFGVHDWAARLIPCLAGVLTVIITTMWGWRAAGFWSGLVSGAILALSGRFLYLAGMLTLDGLLCMWIVAALAAGHLAVSDEQRRQGSWLALSALACALGVLTKGPVALMIVIVPLIVFTMLDSRCRRPSLRESLAALAILAVVAGPWFVVMAWQAPGAAGTFFWLHHFVRYFAPFDHEKPAWFYVPSLLLGMLPWTLLLVPMIGHLRLNSREGRPPALMFFLIAFVWCVVFFSLSGSKRQGYILPAFPLMALMLGTFVTHALPWRRWIPVWGACAAMLVFLVLLLGQRFWLPDYHERFALRRQVELVAEYEQEESLAIVSYPRRWDSISFYAQRNDVESYTFAQIEKLRNDLHAHGKALIFIQGEQSMHELLEALPAELEGRQPLHGRVIVGLIKLRQTARLP